MRTDDVQTLGAWGRAGYAWVSSTFLRQYLVVVRPLGILAERDDERAVALVMHRLEKALCELGYEPGNRPEWVSIPLKGSRNIMAGWTEGV